MLINAQSDVFVAKVIILTALSFVLGFIFITQERVLRSRRWRKLGFEIETAIRSEYKNKKSLKYYIVKDLRYSSDAELRIVEK